jgi:ribosomal RNA-processing protein 17
VRDYSHPPPSSFSPFLFSLPFLSLHFPPYLFHAHSLLSTDAGSDEDGEGEPTGSGSDVDLGSNASGADSDSDSDDSPEQTFESADALTTVSVAPLSFSRSPTPEAVVPRVPKEEKVQEGSKYKKRVRNTVQARPKLTRKDRKEIVTGGKKVKKKMLTRMKGTKARSAR